MEIDDVQLDLEALKKLYGLLERNANLDERVQSLSKRLLDAATREIFDKIPKIISTAQSGCAASTMSRPGPSNAVLTLKPPRPPTMLRTSSSFTRNTATDSRYREALKDGSRVESQMSISSNESDNRRKHCRACVDKSISQGQGLDPSTSRANSNRFLVSTNQLISNGNPRTYEIPRNASTVSSVGCNSTFLAKSCGGDQVQKKLNPASEEVSNTIERIEKQISALKLRCSNLESTDINSLYHSPSRMPSSVSPVELPPNSGLRHAPNSIKRLSHILSQSRNNSPTKIVQASTSRLESNALLPTQKTSPYVKALAQPSLSRSVSQKSQYVHGLRVPQSLSRPSAPLHHPITRSTAVDEGSVTGNKAMRARESVKIRTKEVEEITSNSTSGSSSSSWTSQQTSNTDGDESQSYTSSSPSPIRTATRSFASASSQESNSSHSAEIQHTIQQRGLKPSHLVKTEKTIGTLKRFKNKLGLIFHHHHHHHHHHHPGDGGGNSDHKKSMWPNFYKKFGRKSKGEFNKKRALTTNKKLLKSAIPGKHQVGNFHALVDGLMRHVKRPKKRKTLKKGIDLRRSGRKMGKKMHWWNKVKPRQGGMKFGKKRHAKITGKRPRLKGF